MKNKLIWQDEYSVNVAEIDAQHKQLFETLNSLIDQIKLNPSREDVEKSISRILDYKKYHFETEEKYFDKFNYDGAKEHIEKHKIFNENIQKITNENTDIMDLTFAVVDFLEDWIVDHILTIDKKYMKCFNEHGLY